MHTYSILTEQKTYLLSLTNLKWRYNLFLLAIHSVSAVHDMIPILFKSSMYISGLFQLMA